MTHSIARRAVFGLIGGAIAACTFAAAAIAAVPASTVNIPILGFANLSPTEFVGWTVDWMRIDDTMLPRLALTGTKSGTFALAGSVHIDAIVDGRERPDMLMEVVGIDGIWSRRMTWGDLQSALDHQNAMASATDWRATRRPPMVAPRAT